MASDLPSITSHIHSWVLFLLWLHPFILSGVISPLISGSILGTYRPGEFLFQYHSAFSYCSWDSQGKNTEVVGHSLLQRTTLCQTILRRNAVAIMVNRRVRNAVLGRSLKNDRMISGHFQGKPFSITVIQAYAPTSNAEEAEVEWFYEDR